MFFFPMIGSVFLPPGSVVPRRQSGAELTNGNLLPEDDGMEEDINNGSAAVELAPILAAGEDLKAYVIRRAFEEKRYQHHADLTGINFHWLRKLAKGSIPNPNYNDLRTLAQHYRALERQGTGVA
jgi:hypothetical protein